MILLQAVGQLVNNKASGFLMASSKWYLMGGLSLVLINILLQLQRTSTLLNFPIRDIIFIRLIIGAI